MSDDLRRDHLTALIEIMALPAFDDPFEGISGLIEDAFREKVNKDRVVKGSDIKKVSERLAYDLGVVIAARDLSSHPKVRLCMSCDKLFATKDILADACQLCKDTKTAERAKRDR